MSSQRVLLMSLCAIIAMVSYIEAVPNNLIVGNRVSGDRLIQRETVTEEANWLGQIVSVNRTFEGDRYSKITEVRALDQHTNDHGAMAKLVAGGVGYSYVTLLFESQRFRTIEFIVELYGR